MRISDWSSDVCSSDLSKTCVARCCPSFVHPPTSQGESKLVGARGLRAGANALDDRTREFERGLDTDVTCRRGDTHARPARGGKAGLCDPGSIDIVHGLMGNKREQFGKWGKIERA